MKKAMPLVKESRRETDDAYSFNWSIRISPDLQMPFDPTHENMANLKLSPDQQPVEVLAADLRRAFSGIVAGTSKRWASGAIEQYGPYKLHGDPEMMRRMDDLLQGFVAQHRSEASGRHRLYSLLRNHRLISTLPPGHRLTPAPGGLSSSDFQNALKTFLLLINHLNYFYIAKRLRW